MKKDSELAIKSENIKLWETCIIDLTREEEIKSIVTSINKNKERYDNVSKIVNMPWYIIAIIHCLESSLNFKRHLHNGDPLSAKTVNIPKGRPLIGEPPYSWEVSAVDALTYLQFNKKSYDKIEDILFCLESYNGFGYRRKKINSPYLWAATNNYIKGKYGSDGKYDPELVSKQIGAAALLKSFI